MTTVLIAVQYFLLAFIGILVAYLFVLSCLAVVGRWRTPRKPSSGRRFVFIIPAHNEEDALAPTIESLARVDYPRNLFDIVVIADNCTDRTADVARTGGAEVLVRENRELRGKGYALRFGMDILLQRFPAYDAVVIVDADSVASANFLGILNTYLERGSRVIQAGDRVRPQPGAWSSEMTRMGFTLYNHARPSGRMFLGCSAGLRGNGMCFAADVLRAHPWNSYTRTEDLEFGLYLLVNNIKVEFAAEAAVIATMPVDQRLAESQRARWEGGRFPVIRTYAPLLLRATLKERSFVYLDSLVDLLTPALVNLMAVVGTIGILTAGLALAGVESLLSFAWIWSGVFLLGILHMFLGLYSARADKDLYKALLFVPRYALWKLLLYLKLVRQGDTREWVRTTREPAGRTEKRDDSQLKA
jgi:cellulose synthase/poly-beta-1,6-N-acetylglucosamine synthase-like glycosyltransferase